MTRKLPGSWTSSSAPILRARVFRAGNKTGSLPSETCEVAGFDRVVLGVLRPVSSLVATAFLLLGWSAFAAGVAVETDKDKAKLYLGDYTIVSGEKSGEEIPKERIEGARVRFTEDRIVATDKDNKETFVATYEIDMQKEPHEIKMVSKEPQDDKEHETVGLIEREEETVRLIYALPGGEAPEEFKTKENQQMFVLSATKEE